MTKLVAPHVRVTLDQPDRAEQIEYDVQTDNRDLIRWERISDKNGWPDMRRAPMLWLTHMSWTALRRSGAAVPDKFEAYEQLVVAVDMLDADGEEVDPDDADDDVMSVGGFPTLPAPVPASVSN